jgi:hypothetical protein
MQNQPVNPLLGKLKLPGRTFKLPSGGTLYKNGELTSEDGEIHVHPMSAMTEINLKNPDLLFNGKALQQVCAECVPEIAQPLKLYGRDIDALMVFLRLVTYGPDFQITVKHTCENAKDHNYIVNVEDIVRGMTHLDPTMVDKYQVTLQNGQVVKLLPMKFEQMIKLFQMNANKAGKADGEISIEDIKKNIVFNMVSLIDSVDEVTDKSQIEEWVKAIPSPMQNRIAEVIEKMNEWGPSNKTMLKCKDCGEEFSCELPLNAISFFTE